MSHIGFAVVTLDLLTSCVMECFLIRKCCLMISSCVLTVRYSVYICMMLCFKIVSIPLHTCFCCFFLHIPASSMISEILLLLVLSAVSVTSGNNSV